jgi:hypothetical protein
MAKINIQDKKCITPEFRVSFPQVFEAKSFEGAPPKFSVVMLFSKKTDLKLLKKCVINAATEKWGPKEEWPEGLRLPFKDGDKKKDRQGYEGTIYVSATSKQRPGLVDQNLSPIAEGDGTFYAGCFARAELLAFAYDTAGNKGVSFGLQNIQKTRDGESLSGRKKAEDVFEAIDDGSDDKANYEEDADDIAL